MFLPLGGIWPRDFMASARALEIAEQGLLCAATIYQRKASLQQLLLLPLTLQYIFCYCVVSSLVKTTNDKVNSVQEACIKCFAVHILKCKILQIT